MNWVLNIWKGCWNRLNIFFSCRFIRNPLTPSHRRYLVTVPIGVSQGRISSEIAEKINSQIRSQFSITVEDDTEVVVSDVMPSLTLVKKEHANLRLVLFSNNNFSIWKISKHIIDGLKGTISFYYQSKSILFQSYYELVEFQPVWELSSTATQSGSQHWFKCCDWGRP